MLHFVILGLYLSGAFAHMVNVNVNDIKACPSTGDVGKFCTVESTCPSLENTTCFVSIRPIDKDYSSYYQAPLELFYVWAYSFGSAFFISLAGLWGYFLLPLLTGSYRDHVMNFLVGLSFGSLITSAVCQLIPEAYELNKTVPNYLYIASFTMFGLWLSLLTQSLAAIIKKGYKRKRIELTQKAEIRKLQNETILEKANGYPARVLEDESEETQLPVITEVTILNKEDEHKNQTQISKNSSRASVKKPLKKPTLSKIAIVILAGDCINNLMDGISIGAGYSYSLSTGLKLTMAISLEEYTHKLGDFAIIYQTGISMKRVLFWNYSTSCLCFFGAVIGVTLGNMHWSQYIFSFASGLFLFISLSHLVPELQRMLQKSLVQGGSGFITLLEQHVGIILGFALLIFIN